MPGEHDRYEELAVAHVLGGLDEVAAADFRSHLLQCRRCRRQVAELQDLAADLAAAEREERAQLRLKTAVGDEDAEEGPEGGRGADTDLPWGFGRTASALVAGAVLVVLAALLVWNIDLHQRLRSTAATNASLGDVIDELGEGTPADVEFRSGTHGVVVVDGEDVAASLAGVPGPEPDEVVALWVGDRTLRPVRTYAAGQVADGRLHFVLDVDSARRLLVTVEPTPVGEEPTGPQLAAVPLRAGEEGATQPTGSSASDGDAGSSAPG